jgi:hypothetical protein
LSAAFLTPTEAEEDRVEDRENEKACHPAVEKLDAAAHVGSFFGDDSGVVVCLIGELVDDARGRDILHRRLKVFDTHLRDGAKE